MTFLIGAPIAGEPVPDLIAALERYALQRAIGWALPPLD